MAMDNTGRRRPLGHEIIEISDDDADDDDDDDVVEVAHMPSRRVDQPRRNHYAFQADRDSDGDSPMRDYRPRNAQRQLGFLPEQPRVQPQPDPRLRAIPEVRIPRYVPPLVDPFQDPSPSPNRQQGFKRQRSESPSPLGRPAGKRPVLADQENALNAGLQYPNWLEIDQDGEMFDANLLADPFGMPLPAAPDLRGGGVAPAAEFSGSSKEACMQGILVLFPDILPEHVSNLWESKPGHRSVEGLVNLILQEGDAGRPYPKIVNEAPAMKLKQMQASIKENDPEKKYLDKGRIRVGQDYDYGKESINYLGYDFPWVPKTVITSEFAAAGFFLYPAYLALYEIDRKWTPELPTYSRLQKARSLPPNLIPANLDMALNGALAAQMPIAPRLQELKDARAAKQRLQAKHVREDEIKRAERENEESARALGAIEECGCCFSEYPLNRMVHCSNAGSIHFFCKTCAKTNAETEVGQGKYVLVCMSMDGCSAGFDREQRELFMDAKLRVALERIETEHNLRMAGIENLESCPFCPYAAEYPPISDERIFRCVHPDCGLESCRLCKKVSHIPKTCQEFAKESGTDSHRRRLEDAMSEALVRKCNKCKTPFIKLDGCNKITCTKCRNIQCYICSQDCVHTPHGGTYAHFNDPARGGKEGQCPLFDNTEQRHQEAVEAAQKEAMAKIQAEHPEYTEEELQATIAETAAAKEDREKRAGQDPMVARYGGIHGYGYGAEDLEYMIHAIRAGALRVAGPRAEGNGPAAGLEEDLAMMQARLDERVQAVHDMVEARRARVDAARRRRNGAAIPAAAGAIWDPVWDPQGQPAPLPGIRIHQRVQGPDLPPVGMWNAQDFLGDPVPGPLPGIMIHPHAAPAAVIPAQRMMFDHRHIFGVPALHRFPGAQALNIPAPPPPYDPAGRERKQAQDRALRAAYLRAPPDVQARRRDQMRRKMKDPDLDDAAVERAILHVDEPELEEGEEAALAFPPRNLARDVPAHLQKRNEEPEARPAASPVPSPPAAQNLGDDDGAILYEAGLDVPPRRARQDGMNGPNPNYFLPGGADGQALHQYPQDPQANIRGEEGRDPFLLPGARQHFLAAVDHLAPPRELAFDDEDMDFDVELEQMDIDRMAALLDRHIRADIHLAPALRARHLNQDMENMRQGIIGEVADGNRPRRRANFRDENAGAYRHGWHQPPRINPDGRRVPVVHAEAGAPPAPHAQAPDVLPEQNAAAPAEVRKRIVDPIRHILREVRGGVLRPGFPFAERPHPLGPPAAPAAGPPAAPAAGRGIERPRENHRDLMGLFGLPMARRRRGNGLGRDLAWAPRAREDLEEVQLREVRRGPLRLAQRRPEVARPEVAYERGLAPFPAPGVLPPPERYRSRVQESRASQPQPAAQDPLLQTQGPAAVNADASPDLANSPLEDLLMPARQQRMVAMPGRENSDSDDGDLANLSSSPAAIAVRRPSARRELPWARRNSEADRDAVDDVPVPPRARNGNAQSTPSLDDEDADRQPVPGSPEERGAEFTARNALAEAAKHARGSSDVEESGDEKDS